MPRRTRVQLVHLVRRIHAVDDQQLDARPDLQLRERDGLELGDVDDVPPDPRAALASRRGQAPRGAVEPHRPEQVKTLPHVGDVPPEVNTERLVPTFPPRTSEWTPGAPRFTFSVQ